ncbi:hypothetical protein AND_010390 [Anopheles darlingi]|uniref:Uncharacterized protein n=1 Tax=Anopheles darlingi TaxID=43151 RepID=W5J2P8_ANODA|nr:hypothetical protein AND_010390 [Anopheles darlingi]
MPIEPLQEAIAKQAAYFLAPHSRRNRERQEAASVTESGFCRLGRAGILARWTRDGSLARKRLEQIDCANMHGPRAVGPRRSEHTAEGGTLYVNI